MANEANRPDDVEPRRANETDSSANMDRARDNADVVSASPSTPESATPEAAIPESVEDQTALVSDREVPLEASSDPADAIPVPPAMSPAEIDERAQAVEAVRANAGVDTVTKVDPETDVTP